jgi:hypothetical protein
VASAVPPVLVASGVIPLPPATTTTITATTRHYPIPTASTPTTMRLAQHVSVEPTASYYFPTPPPSATASPASGSARVVTTALPTTLPAPAAAIGRPQMPHPLTMLSLTAAAGAHRPQVPAQSALASQLQCLSQQLLRIPAVLHLAKRALSRFPHLSPQSS